MKKPTIEIKPQPKEAEEVDPQIIADMKRRLSPAEEGERAAKADARQAKFVEILCNDFKTFVHDSLSHGHAENFDDHMEFMKACMETWAEGDDEDPNGGA